MPLFRRGSSGGGSSNEQPPVTTAAAASPPPDQHPPQAPQPASTALRTPPQPASLASTVTPAAPVPLTVPLGGADTHILRFQSWVYDEQAQARRFLVLEGHTLAFYPDENNTSPMVGQENVERLPLGGDAVLDFVAGASGAASHSPARMVFCVRAGGARFVFSCERAADESEWIEHIQETIEAMKRHSEHAELAGLLLNNPSANGTVLSTTTTVGAAAERGTPVSEQRLAMSAPSLPPSERASCRAGAVPAPSTPTPMLQQLQQEQQQAGPTGKAASTSAPATALDDDERLLAPASSLEEPVTPAISGREEMEGAHPALAPHPGTGPALPLATPPPSGAVWPASAPSSTLPTPWGEAVDDPTAAIAAPGVHSGSPGKEGMVPALAVTFAGATAQQLQQHHQHPAVLTTSALQELGGLRKGPSADREDVISLEERKQRVVEGMRRSSRAASEAVVAAAATTAAAASGAAVPTTASADAAPAVAGAAAAPGGEAAEPERDVYVFQGWVKMSRRRWYMLLNAGKGGKVGRRLDFYGSLADLEACRPPKETILLTSGCIVESRRLPLPPSSKGLASMVTAAAPASSGGSHNASSSTAYSSGATPTTTSSFSDTLEPDSVIDLLIPTNSGSKGLRTLTLQAFTVEEENRWISELQLAIGALTEADDEELFGAARDSGVGTLFSRTRELSGPLAAPQACCTIS